MNLRPLTLALALAGTVNLSAHKEPFGYVRGAQVEPKGEWEFTQWATARLGKETGRYLGMNFATELEYGFTDRFQAAVYLLSNYHLLSGAAGGREVFDDRNRFGVSGTSLELKYQLRDPWREAYGLALYLEPGYRTIGSVSGERGQEFELESRLIVEKHFLDHRLITAFNFVVEPEWEREHGVWETALVLEWSAGASWQLNGNWRLGIEGRLTAEFADADLDDAEFLAFHLGPTLFYSADKWFASLTVLPQVAGWPEANGTGGLHLDDKERVEIRLKLGAEF